MHKTILSIGGGVALAMALAACGGDADEPAPAQTTGASQTAGAGSEEVDKMHNDADTAFAQMMIVHHQGAIEMADLAAESAASEEVRSLAERISAAQGPEIEQMEAWLEAWGEDAGMAGHQGHGGMDHGGMEMEGMSQEEAMTELEGLSGAELDRRFLELMIAHHQGAVEMAQTELDSGENPQALELAQKIIDDQQAEIAEMEQLLETR